MEEGINIATVLISAIALAVSFYSVLVNRRSVITSSISSQRIEWISTVRELIIAFAEEYKNNGCNGNKDALISIYTKIVLYCNPKSDVYSSFISAMKECILCDTFSDILYWRVITEGQIVLNSSWRRMKREAGVSYRRERENARRFKGEEEDNPGMKWTSKIR